MLYEMNRNGIDPNEIDGFGEILSPFDNISDACNLLNSKEKQNRYFAKYFDFVEAEQVVLGQDDNGKDETYVHSY